MGFVYLDHHATTPLDERVLEEMLPFFGEHFGNAASRHVVGRDAAAAVEDARASVAELIGARAREIIFLSGATEANNLALRGLAEGPHSGRTKIVTTAIEHSSVLGPLDLLAKRDFEVEVVPVDEDGQLELDRLEGAIDDRTLVVSVAAANHEIGALAPLGDVAELAHARGALLHSDAAQAVGKVPVDVDRDGVDLLSLSAHKLYGPKGTGALFVSADAQHRIRPLIVGGGHERGLRSGTLDVPGVVGLGAAARIALDTLEEESSRLQSLRDRLLDELQDRLSDIEVNGGPSRLPGNLNLYVPGVDAEALMASCPDVAFSVGSACSSMTPSPSHVLMALRDDAERAEQSIRLCVGRTTTRTDVDRAAELIASAAMAVRRSTVERL